MDSLIPPQEPDRSPQLGSDQTPTDAIVAPSRLRSIRPWQLFAMYTAPLAERTITTPIPHRRAWGGINLLETFCLIAGMRAVNARHAWEFGTFLGATTLNIALNLPEDGRVYTFDLSPEEAANLDQHPEDKTITECHMSHAMDFEGLPVERKITRIYGNSLSFDPAPWAHSCDFVFIDGGHDIATVTADTRSAFTIVRKNGAIFWHDYANPSYADLSTFLEGLSEDVFHIGDTMLCGLFLG
jgi:precorrin-6B methylase 2